MLLRRHLNWLSLVKHFPRRLAVICHIGVHLCHNERIGHRRWLLVLPQIRLYRSCLLSRRQVIGCHIRIWRHKGIRQCRILLTNSCDIVLLR